MKELRLNNKYGPDDRIIFNSKLSHSDNNSKIFHSTRITRKTIKNAFGDHIDIDLKCQQNCVGDCSCVNDYPCYLLVL